MSDIQAELNQTALELVRTQRSLQQTQQQLKAVLDKVLEVAKSHDNKQLQSIQDIVAFLDTLKKVEGGE